jgi:hypothetical protein
MKASMLCRRRRQLVATIVAVLSGSLTAWVGSPLMAPAHAAARHAKSAHRDRGPKPPRIASPRRLVFGIYPGGAAGTVGPSGPLAPEDPVKRLAALEQLRPAGAPFVLHLYAAYTGSSGYSAAAQVGAAISSYTAHGFEVELVLCYRPAELNPSRSVPGFVAFVRRAVDDLGSNPGVVSLQDTNEANLGGAPNASDGYYPGAKDALIRGVIAAKHELTLDHFGQLKIGFNWAYAADASEQIFWSYLRRHGGSAFVRALDWVGLDAYPGTWGPALATRLSLGDAVRRATVGALSALRHVYLPRAGIPASVPIHVTESGYPTGPGRSYDAQADVLCGAVRAVVDDSATYNVTDYRWFDLRDADSSSASFEAQYGLMTDAYTPKPAFALYRRLVSAPSVTCSGMLLHPQRSSPPRRASYRSASLPAWRG